MGRERAGWVVLAGLLFAFWAAVVLYQGKWLAVRAWGGFAGGVYVLYWQFYTESGEESDRDAVDADERR